MAGDQKRDSQAEANELLKTMLIVQLGVAGVPQLKIREIVGVKIERVNQIVKLLNPKNATKKKER